MREFDLNNTKPHLMTGEEMASERDMLRPILEALRSDGHLRHIMVFAPEVRPWGREALILAGPRQQLFQNSSLYKPEVLVEVLNYSYRSLALNVGLEYETDAEFIPNDAQPGSSILKFPRMTSGDGCVRVYCYPDWEVAAEALRTHWPEARNIPVAEPFRPLRDVMVHYYSPDVYAYNPTLGSRRPLMEQATVGEMAYAHIVNDHDGEYWDGPRNA